MNIQNAQQQVDDWIKNHGVRYFNELTNMAQLTEEVGDVLCMIGLMVDNDVVKWEDLQERVEYKKEKLKKWSTLV